MVWVIMLLQTAVAATLAGQVVWQGGTQDGEWHDAGNWKDGAVPTAEDIVSIRATPECQVSGASPASARYMTVGGGVTLFVRGEGASLRVGTSLNLSGGTLRQKGGSINCATLGVRRGAYSGTRGSLTVGKSISVGSAGGKGTVTIAGVDGSVGQVVYNGPGKIKGTAPGHGEIAVSGGNLRVNGNFFNAHHMWSKPLPEGQKHCGRLTVSGGEVNVAGNFYNGFGPDVSQVQGVLEIVGAKGRMTVEGDFVQIGDSTLVAELSGPKHTVIRVLGNAKLAGTLKVRLAKGYTPQPETWWNILQGSVGSPIGTFAALDFTEAGGADGWRVEYDTDERVVRLGYCPASGAR